MVLDLAAEEVEPEFRDLRQNDAFIGNPVGHDDVERADPVGGDDEQLVAEVVDVAHLAPHRLVAGNIRLLDDLHGNSFQ